MRVYGVAEGTNRDVISYPDYLDARAAAKSLDLAAHAVTSARIGGGESLEVRTVELVTGNYFRALGLAPSAAGRSIDERDAGGEGTQPVAVLVTRLLAPAIRGEPCRGRSDARRERRRVHDHRRGAGVVSRHLQRARHRSVGAADDAPVGEADRNSLSRRGWGWLSMIGRLQPSADLPPLDTTSSSPRPTSGSDFRITHVEVWSRHHAGLRRERSRPDGDGADPGMAYGFTVLLMIVTCANLAGVMQARLAARRREMAIRQSLGAGRGRLASRMDDRMPLPRRSWAAWPALRSPGLSARRSFAPAGAAPAPRRSVVRDDSRLAAGDLQLRALARLGTHRRSRARMARRPLRAFAVLKDESGTVTSGRRGARLRRIGVLVQVTSRSCS